MNDTAFVRTHILEARTPPIKDKGAIAWARKNLFATPFDTVLTLFLILIAYHFIKGMLGFLFFDAVYLGDGGEACRGAGVGACWPFVTTKINFFLYGFYPQDELWRANLFFGLLIALIIPLMIPSVPFKKLNIFLFFIVLPLVSYFLLSGGVFGLTEVDVAKWGGLLVTIIVGLTGIVFSLPLGILLALGRRSELPIIRFMSTAFIEFWRGVPLITVLFMASVMFPLFMPEGVNFDKLLRCLIGVTLFASAYMAEVVRGGLQAIPKGQFEAASALGLNYSQSMRLIVMPQALKLVIPGIVNSFISLFKDTTLVSIVGIFDLLLAVSAGVKDQYWAAPIVPLTGYLFAGIVFWIFCFGMSRYSMFWERRLDTGHRE